MRKNSMVIRRGYLDYLWGWKDVTDTVKIVTGIRRCGKSTLMCQMINRLKASGVPGSDIFYMNMESSEADDIPTFRELNVLLRGRLPKGRRCYVLMDEVQRVEHWERTVNSLAVDYDADVYLTGSNGYLLSSELSTYISGRYVEVKMTPLSFSEYLEMHPVAEGGDVYSRFNDYIWLGGMPQTDPEDPDRSRDLLEGIYSTAILRDVAGRLGLRDTSALDRIARFLYSNVGNVTNVNAIAKALRLSDATVAKYVDGMVEAFIFYQVDRYDIRGKKLLHTNGKFYPSDTGIRNSVLRSGEGSDVGRQMENVVFLELVRRGYDVTVGSYLDREVDFTARKRDDIEYFQVCQSLASETTYEREVRSLTDIRDSFPKTILTMDRVVSRPPDGIRTVNIVDWLLGRRRRRLLVSTHFRTEPYFLPWEACSGAEGAWTGRPRQFPGLSGNARIRCKTEHRLRRLLPNSQTRVTMEIQPVMFRICHNHFHPDAN